VLYFKNNPLGVLNMKPIEISLTGDKTTPNHIVRAMQRHCNDLNLERIEVQYSTQAKHAINAADLHSATQKLLREHALSDITVSVRQHRLPLDDAQGTHIVRFCFAAPIVNSQNSQSLDAEDVTPNGSNNALDRFKQLFWPKTMTDNSAAQVPPKLTLSAKESSGLIQAALKKPLERWKHRQQANPVGHIEVKVMDESLHESLVKLLGLKAENNSAKEFAAALHTNEWFKTELKKLGLKTMPELSIGYRFEPMVAGEGTQFIFSGDLEIQFGREPTVKRTTTQHTSLYSDIDGTALPMPPTSTLLPKVATNDLNGTLLPLTKQPEAIVRVLGTKSAMFEKPFELKIDQLPAKFDRNALECAGFGREHGELLRVASRSFPLWIKRGPNGELTLQAQARSDKAAGLPMFYFVSDSSPLTSSSQHNDGLALLFVNSPDGVWDPQQNKLLPALIIQVQLLGKNTSELAA
jgi:hypothetical protein